METSHTKYPILHNVPWLTEQIKDKPLRDIAKEVGCSYSAVIYVSRLYGIVVPKRRLRPNPNRFEINREAYKRRWPNGRFGKDASNWRGGRRRSGTKGSYIAILSPEHPNADSEGYVMEHRLVMEKHLGRYLKREEVVHHKNGNKKDNRIENLELVESSGKHLSEHFQRSFLVEQKEIEIDRLKQILDNNGIKY